MLQKGSLLQSDNEYTQIEVAEAATSIGPTIPIKEDVDQHGLQVGRWKAGIMDCFDTCIPNGWF